MSTFEDESEWVEHKQHELIMKMTTDHFVESAAKESLGKAAAEAVMAGRNSNQLLAEVQMVPSAVAVTDSNQVLNRKGVLLHRNMVD